MARLDETLPAVLFVLAFWCCSSFGGFFRLLGELASSEKASKKGPLWFLL